MSDKFLMLHSNGMLGSSSALGLGGIEPSTQLPQHTRTNVLLLKPNGSQYRKLTKLCQLSAVAWNKLNYMRRRCFFQEIPLNFNVTGAQIYHQFKSILKVNIRQLIRKNDAAWRCFFRLLRLRSQGKLPWFIQKLNPPGYWKDRETGKRNGILIVRSDRYRIAQDQLELLDFKLKIKLRGCLRWAGAQGDLEIIQKNGRFYAHIPIRVGALPPKSNPNGYISGERDRVQLHSPRSDLVAAIDLGVNNLATVFIQDGSWLVYKGGIKKSQWLYWEHKIAKLRSLKDRIKQLVPRSPLIHTLARKIGKLYAIRTRRMAQLDRNLASHLARTLWEAGVSKVFIGYPKYIAQNGNVHSANIWSYARMASCILNKLQEYGIQAELVDEANTSSRCWICGGGIRIRRGLFSCPQHGVINADLNGAINILRNQVPDLRIKNPTQPKSFIIHLNGITPLRGNREETSPSGTLALKGGEEVNNKLRDWIEAVEIPR